MCLAATIFLGILVFSQSKSSFGSLANGITAKYPTASSSVSSFSAATTLLATSTSRTRDYFRMQVVSGTAWCLMGNGVAASVSNYSFVLASTSPFFSMEQGVYQGNVSCAGTAVVSIVEANL